MSKNCNRKRAFLVVALGVLSSLFVLPAFATEIVLGGKVGWPAFQYEENLTKGKGRYGYECVELATNSFVFDDYTDLLINFEDQINPIAAGDYSIIRNNLKNSDQTILDKSAGLSRNIGGLYIKGKPGTFFGSEGLMGSFAIEFWLCPSIAENGEVIINWETSKNIANRLVYQVLNCGFTGGHLEWTLSNFFDTIGTPIPDEIKLKGTSTIIPGKWGYHVLSYDAETGILEYIVNGVTEDLIYVTSTGREDGQISLVILGEPSEVEFCTEYTGKIDDIRILRRPYSPPDYQSAEVAGKVGHVMYVPYGGRFVSQPIMVSNGSTLNSLTAEMSVPTQTAVCFYVRSGDNFYGWTENYPEWIAVESGEELKGITGLYFQVSAELFPDGGGDTSPSITTISLDFTELPEPLPPFVVKAEAGNGSVTLSWNYSVDDTAGGYYVYYGTRPGEYLGRFALEGESPINVGNVSSYTITGLENGKIYYFAIAAWSMYDDRVVGNLSKEVFARPLARLKK